jgi:hypothetical protein
MGVTDKMWDAITTVIKMNDKVERMTEVIKAQQQKIETMNERLIRLETALQLGMARESTIQPRTLEQRSEQQAQGS